MLELIYAIPENVGWALVGAAGAFTVMMAITLGKTIYRAIKCYLDEDYEA